MAVAHEWVMDMIETPGIYMVGDKRMDLCMLVVSEEGKLFLLAKEGEIGMFDFNEHAYLREKLT